MKTLKISLCAVLIICLTACAHSEFRDLAAFITGYNSGSDTLLSLTDFSFTESDSYIRYTAQLNDRLLLSLEALTTGEIYKARVFLSKVDGDISDEEASVFVDVFSCVCRGLCDSKDTDIASLIAEFSLGDKATLKKQGELTKDTDSFRFVFYSTEVSAEMMITNEHLMKTEPTKKPVSRPYFAEATSIREHGATTG